MDGCVPATSGHDSCRYDCGLPPYLTPPPLPTSNGNDIPDPIPCCPLVLPNFTSPTPGILSDQCPQRLLYLIGGSLLCAALMFCRTISSVIMNRGCSTCSTAVVSILGLIYSGLLLVNLVILAMNVHYIAKNFKNGSNFECKGGVYEMTLIYVYLQYLLYLLTLCMY